MSALIEIRRFKVKQKENITSSLELLPMWRDSEGMDSEEGGSEEMDCDEKDSEDESLNCNWFLTLWRKTEEDVEAAEDSMADVNTSVPPAENSYHLPDLITDLKRIFKFAPLWSNILMEISSNVSSTPTSSQAERLFGVLKHNVFKFEKTPMRNDSAIQILLEYIEISCTKFSDELQKHADNEHDSKLTQTVNGSSL